jgi:hypothetical protein
MERIGLKNVDMEFVMGHLVDRARNLAAMSFLSTQKQWLWFFDADMQWTPDIIDKMFEVAFKDCPWASIIGGWCPLRGEPYLPTIDTGSGHWESHMPGQGPLEVIRTGSACVLVKREVFERMEYPWYGVRPAPRAIDMLAEVDGFARQRFDGRNPFEETEEWHQLVNCARDGTAGSGARPDFSYNTVGEDSNFCDKAKALGFRIVVQTNAVCNHVDRKVITPADHAESMRKSLKSENLGGGIVE